MTLIGKNMPDLKYELQHPGKIIAGVDEAGRGPLAGPVVAAAVIIDQSNLIEGIKDSKKLSRAVRESLYEKIITNYIWGVGMVSAAEIDEINILQATIKACILAVEDLGCVAWRHQRCLKTPPLKGGSPARAGDFIVTVEENPPQSPFTKGEALGITHSLVKTPDIILVDGNMKFTDSRFISIIKGDDLSISIAAASIIAKVTRDRLMEKLGEDFPYYLWHKNSAYGTREHLRAIAEHGLSPHHRKSFKIESLGNLPLIKRK